MLHERDTAAYLVFDLIGSFERVRYPFRVRRFCGRERAALFPTSLVIGVK